MKTGIAVLDEMLGGDGIPDGSVVLLRGGPGTGKTTLALQIAADHLAQDDTHNYAIFISLETTPKLATKHVARAFGFKLNYPGKFMVTESYEENELPTEDGSNGPWCITGDDLDALVDEGYDFLSSLTT